MRSALAIQSFSIHCMDMQEPRPAHRYVYGIDGRLADSRVLLADRGPYALPDRATIELTDVLVNGVPRELESAELCVTGASVANTRTWSRCWPRRNVDDDRALMSDDSMMSEISVSISPVEVFSHHLVARGLSHFQPSDTEIHERSKKAGVHTIRYVRSYVLLSFLYSDTIVGWALRLVSSFRRACVTRERRVRPPSSSYSGIAH
jgi:hypothetical protein